MKRREVNENRFIFLVLFLSHDFQDFHEKFGMGGWTSAVQPKKIFFGAKHGGLGSLDEGASPLGQLGEARKFLVSGRTSRCIHRLKLLAFITALLFNPWADWQHGRCQGLDGLIYVLVKEVHRNGVVNLDGGT